MRRLIVLVPLAAVALHFALSSPEPSVDAPDAPEAPASAAAPERLPDIALAVDDDAPRVRRNRYRLTFAQDVTVAGVEQDGVRVEGTWTTEQLADGRVEVVLAADHLEGPAGMPSARALAAPVQWVARDGALVGMGFSDGAPAMARHVMTALATTLWSDDRDAARWEVEAEDVTGRFVAAYARADGAVNVVTRTRPAWRALRSPAGLTTTLAKAVLSDEDSRFERDADGLVEANVSLTTVFEPEGDLPTVVGRVRARLVREDSVEVARRGGGDLAIGPIDDHPDLRARQAATDRATVDGASVAELVAEVERVAALDPEAAETARWRSVTMKRLAARVRTDPASARALA
ncbi:MAG: hypothetical protein KC583_19390, partial [Myxococcales bacterium]|nr:hypothetical protein [Myxococcales bacterium]